VSGTGKPSLFSYHFVSICVVHLGYFGGQASLGRELPLLYFNDAGGLWDDGCPCRSSGCKLTLLVSFVTILLGSDFERFGK